ncbi:hypothetical protein D4764_03G0013330 [Takifugu flavidus]|uniref:Uncharacterized protein n=1 Tax=Takifugu flavidus TaxID=433684 RepID=A0A5C6NB35_9TELE|nr:hypothetical protein D4764_03G0013330 [Takifugu flavidus]
MSFLHRVARCFLRLRGGVPGMSHQEEALRQTQDTLERWVKGMLKVGGISSMLVMWLGPVILSRQ